VPAFLFYNFVQAGKYIPAIFIIFYLENPPDAARLESPQVALEKLKGSVVDLHY
jgi:hypothetical protein